jgi:tRNA threonylcarbamoyladenosine biosynthesis protein TsaE
LYLCCPCVVPALSLRWSSRGGDSEWLFRLYKEKRGASANSIAMQRRLVSAEATRALGEALGRSARAGDVLWLHGELGAGKTELTKGVAVGMDCISPVSSPSFALIHEYTGGALPLYHADLYRLEGAVAAELGLEEYLEGEGVTVVEWGERLAASFFTDGIDLILQHADAEDERYVTLTARGPAGEAWLQQTFPEDA